MKRQLLEQCAAPNPSKEKIQLLLEEGVRITCTNENGYQQTPLLCFMGNTTAYRQDDFADILRLLVANEDNVNAVNNDGCNALHLLFRHWNYDAEWVSTERSLIEIVKLFLAKNIDLNDENNKKDTAICVLCYNYGGQAVKLEEILKLMNTYGSQMSQNLVKLVNRNKNIKGDVDKVVHFIRQNAKRPSTKSKFCNFF